MPRHHCSNSQWYQAKYPDVAVKFEDPVLHYLLHGGREGRASGPHFDGGAYLQANLDVANSQSNPLLHYILKGYRENRQIMRVGNGPSQAVTDSATSASSEAFSVGTPSASATIPGTSAPSPTRPRSSPNAPSRPACANGPMHPPSTLQTKAQPNCPGGEAPHLDPRTTSSAPPFMDTKVEAKAMTGRKLSILTLFVRHGVEKYRNALSELDFFYLKNIPGVSRTLIIVDNIENASFVKELSKDLIVVGGDNEYWEFSSWDSAIKFVEPRLMRYDYVHLVTSAFGELYTKYIHLIDERMLLNLQGRPVAVGHIDAYNTPIRLLGRVSQSWARSSFVFIPPTVLRLLGSLVSFRNPSLFFTGDAKSPFLPDAPLCREYQANILNWLTGPGTGQGTEWHSRFDLTDETISLFEAKALAILNEHALSIRLRAFGATTVDVTWFANCLRQQDQGRFRAMRLPHWREQLAARKPYLISFAEPFEANYFAFWMISSSPA